jgi:hypothetical protein
MLLVHGCYDVQVKQAIPSVEERTYRKGQLLVEQGKVPDGFFLILQGTCELVLLNLEQHSGNGAANGPGGATGGSPGGLGLLSTGASLVLPAVKKESDMDFAAELSDSTSDDDEEEEEEEDDDDAGQQQSPQQKGGVAFAHGSYSPLAQSFNWSSSFSRADSSRSPSPPLALAAAAALAGVPLPAAPVAAPAGDAVNGSELLEEQQQQQQQEDAGPISLEHVLPDLLPAPRWQHTGTEYTSTNTDSTSNTPAAVSGRATPDPGTSTSCPLPRLPAVSAGPVMMRAVQAADAAAAVAAAAAAAEATFSLDGGSSRPCSASGRVGYRGHSQSVDFSAFERQQLPQLRRQVSKGADHAVVSESCTTFKYNSSLKATMVVKFSHQVTWVVYEMCFTLLCCNCCCTAGIWCCR